MNAKKKCQLALLCLFFTHTISVVKAQVPNVFTAGTPARASEVNENFKALDDEISTLSARIDSIEEGTPANPSQVLNYDAVDSSIGSYLNIAGKKYRYVKMPVVGNKFGQKFAVAFLQSVSNANETDVVFSTAYGNEQCQEQDAIYFGDYLAQYNLSQERVVDYEQSTQETFFDGEFDQFKLARFNVFSNYSLSVCLNLDGALVKFNYLLKDSEVSNTNLSNGEDFDLSDNVSWTSLQSNQAVIQTLDQLIDYIRIEQLQ